MATTGTLREQWQAAKQELQRLEMDIKLFNKGLGPTLDAFEDALDKFDKIQTDQAASDKARKVVASKQDKRILISQQVEQVVIIPPSFQAFSVNTSF